MTKHKHPIAKIYYLPADPKPANDNEGPLQLAGKICHNCGEINLPTYIYCLECGRRLS